MQINSGALLGIIASRKAGLSSVVTHSHLGEELLVHRSLLGLGKWILSFTFPEQPEPIVFQALAELPNARLLYTAKHLVASIVPVSLMSGVER